MTDAGRWMMIMGAVLFAVGALISIGGRLPWFGKLPGDVVYRGPNLTVFIPIASMIVVSIVLTVVLNLFARWFR